MREKICLALGAMAIVLFCPSCGAKKSAESNAPASERETASHPSRFSGPAGETPVSSNPLEPLLPDPKMTPGDALDVTKDDVCVPGYSKKVRNVPQAVKEQAYASYGITHREKGQYEVDHLISLELGGSNSIKNLWPQSFKTKPWNAHVKDALENKLHEEICGGQIEMRQAQQEIAQDWIAAYKKHFHTNGPTASHNQKPETNADDKQDERSETAAHAPGDKVWVNTGSGKYWYPGTEYYGKTKQGQYMTEAEARKDGYVAAKGQ